jgi:hypothetical protein
VLQVPDGDWYCPPCSSASRTSGEAVASARAVTPPTAKRVASQMLARDDDDEDYDDASPPPLPELSRAPSSLLSDLTARLLPASSQDRIALAVRAAKTAAIAATTTASGASATSGKGSALSWALNLQAPASTSHAHSRRHELLSSYVRLSGTCVCATVRENT